jgi:hypothetical protein
LTASEAGNPQGGPVATALPVPPWSIGRRPVRSGPRRACSPDSETRRHHSERLRRPENASLAAEWAVAPDRQRGRVEGETKQHSRFGPMKKGTQRCPRRIHAILVEAMSVQPHPASVRPPELISADLAYLRVRALMARVCSLSTMFVGIRNSFTGTRRQRGLDVHPSRKP